MKQILITVITLLFTSSLIAQQLPISENYFVDKYSLSSAYAGNSSNNMFFASYRKDWSGITEGPKTIRVSYNDDFKTNAGYGGKIILDKIGIFESLFAIGSYSYRVKLDTDSKLLFGLSAGMHRNSINFSDYYNDPSFTSDPSMINKDVKSKVKFVSDISVVYSRNSLNAGILFSNVGISNYKYAELHVKYSPFTTYQLHVDYTLPIQESLTMNPTVIYRGGKAIPDQLELGSNLVYREKVWGSLSLRGKNIFCAGFGMNLNKGIIFNYSYNFSTSIVLSAFQTHELSIGLRLGDLLNTEKSLAAN